MTFSADCVTNFLRASRSPGGCNSQSTADPLDLYIKFKYARLRDSFLTHMRRNKALHVIYPGISDGTKIRSYEVLTAECHAQFLDIQREGQKFDVNVWHIEGVIRDRAKDGGEPIYLYKPS